MSNTAEKELGTQDDSYASRTGQSEIPVQGDNVPINEGQDATVADSDAQLGRTSSPQLRLGHR